MAGLITRRESIRRLLGGSGALLTAPFFIHAAKAKPEGRLGVALVGLGYYSTDLLAPALQQTKHCHLAGIVTGTPSRIPTWQQRYRIPDKNIYNYQNFDQIASNPDIDVVYVVLPPSMHREYVIRAAAAGKHVWCEKPMAPSVADCQAMIDACKKHQRSLAIGYRLHHEPHWKKFRGIIQQKQIGEVRGLSCAAGYRETRTNHWKQKKEMGGGVLGDMGVYAIQGARHGMEMEPLQVLEARISQERPDIYRNGLDEIVQATLEFPGGIQAGIKTSFAENVNFLNIQCVRGEINMAPYSGYGGLRGKSTLGEIYFPYEVPFQQAAQMDDDALAIMKKTPVMAPGEEGLRDIRVVEAIFAAAASGKSTRI
jgi:glucose-fructose oxidoreductase